MGEGGQNRGKHQENDIHMYTYGSFPIFFSNNLCMLLYVYVTLLDSDIICTPKLDVLFRIEKDINHKCGS